MDRKAPHNVAFDAENRGVSVVLCQVLCLYAFVVGDTPLLYLKGGDRMEKILRLNEQDIVQALADHFNVDRAKVNLTVKIRTEGYGPTEHQFPEVSAVIKEG